MNYAFSQSASSYRPPNVPGSLNYQFSNVVVETCLRDFTLSPSKRKVGRPMLLRRKAATATRSACKEESSCQQWNGLGSENDNSTGGARGWRSDKLWRHTSDSKVLQRAPD